MTPEHRRRHDREERILGIIETARAKRAKFKDEQSRCPTAPAARRRRR